MGTEAPPLRKLLFVVLLLVVAFMGGVLVQGSNPPWLRALLGTVAPASPGIKTVSASSLAHTSDEGQTRGAIPAAPLPPLMVGPVPEEIEHTGNPPESGPPAIGADKEAGSVAPEATGNLAVPSVPEQAGNASPASVNSLPASAVPSGAPRKIDELPQVPPADSPSEARKPEPLDPGVSRPAVGLDGDGNSGGDGNLGRGLTTGKVPDPGWADAPGSAPPTAALTRSNRQARGVAKVDQATVLAQGRGNSEQARPSSTRQSEWADVLHRMQSLGVGKYWIEGEPDGSVLFRCVIPVAGQRAVGQQFEGEGTDPISAATVALRRVALWKATEMP
jgi:hypothetical protein